MPKPDVYEFARKQLLADAEWNEGEPCWCAGWWWEEQAGANEGDHMEACQQKRALLEEITHAEA